MKRVKGIILCEGETDQVLISSYLERVEGWGYFHNKNSLFPGERVTWYKKQGDEILGVWQIGGHDFAEPLRRIVGREKLESNVERIVVVTDHDDEDAERERLVGVFRAICDEAGASFTDYDFEAGRWYRFRVDNAFGGDFIDAAYLLVPKDEIGALETFMLDALSEQDESKREVVVQARRFVADFESDIYLRRRRERTKAELGVSLAVFSPDRVFTTMEELINSVNWEDFDLSHRQFSLLREIG